MRACDYHVYRIQYNTTFAERVSTYGGMDSELTGKRISENRNYLCVAPNQDFALTVFRRYHKEDLIIKLEDIGQLNDIVSTQ